ncbi:formylglycine-generating enzyme family protein [Virgibacillus doumboii]|uniref:formylglycine-generating enzyme family protein n=1 Tax=Virgibacillus doumboii TaxID=2697503 RepID=UPI003CCC93E8
MEKQIGCCSVSRNSGVYISDTSTVTKSKKVNTNDMVYLSGGTFLMGTESEEGFPTDGEGPVKEVTVQPFYIDPCTVTNKQFEEFSSQTGYTTDAEKFGWSFVFYSLVSEQSKKNVAQVVRDTPWWWAVKGASWKHPEGPDSTIKDRMDHPVVHVSWNDAKAFCEWSGKRLLTESEWEFAARGGLVGKRFPWGDNLHPKGEFMCNIWQGDFPKHNSAKDGYLSTAPAKSFPANNYGLYNVSGNVWEWCADWFSTHSKGEENNFEDPLGETKVIKGGSYLCHVSYCNRYRVAARSSNTPDSSTGHMGFRCAADG